ncbi:MAG: hypothetical protein IT434_10105 [Phycisphaerales bacterium]|nr:hypothetical protein [Phycisphaerales bacterium]
MAKRAHSQLAPTLANDYPIRLSVLTPSQVVQHFSADEWEAFVLEAIGASEPKYSRIERRGGAGDQGRDVIACTADTPQAGPFDIYQCKAYGKPLGLSDVWTELGKLCVFTHRGDYPMPRRYRFAAPHGVTTPLGNLLDNPVELRKKVIEHWTGQCESRVSQGQRFPLAGALKACVEEFNFGIVHYSPINELLDLHKKTPHWSTRFKRDYPVRPKADAPPPDLQPHEMRYVRQLLDAYGQHVGTTLADVSALGSNQTLSQHFHGCRTDFFMADGLNRFYRDQFPEGAFEHVKEQVEQGVRNTVLAPHQSGFHRVCATLSQAAGLALAQTEYVYCVQPGDKSGLCHHLANDDKLKWVQP